MAVSAVLMQSVRVVKSPRSTCGRSLVAITSRLAPGRCILEELPYAYALCDEKKGLYCDFCLKKGSTLKKCTRCNYVSYCNKSCQKGDWARCHKHDCKTLKKIDPRHPDLHGAQLLSQLIRKQRKSAPCTQDDEDCFPTTVDQLESHLKYARKDNIESLLCVLQQFFEEDVLAEPSSLVNMYGAINCNSFSICDNGLIGIASGIYLRASMVNHSCDPNCAWVFDGRKLQLRTIKDVKEGEECTISYIDNMDPTKERQAKLEKRYHFTCKCVKCVEEINTLEPGGGLGEELRDRLKKSFEQIQDAENLQDWAKVLELCEPYLKPMDPSSSLPVNHLLLVKLREKVMTSCKHSQAWEAHVEMGQLNIESVRYHCGPYSAKLGIHLLGMANILFEMGRLQEARKYLTEAKRVLEVTHGPQHSLMLTKVQELCDLAVCFPFCL